MALMKLTESGEWVDVESVKRWTGDDWTDVYPDGNAPDAMLGKTLDSLMMWGDWYTRDNVQYGPNWYDPDPNLGFSVGAAHRPKDPGYEWSVDQYQKNFVRAKELDSIKIAGANMFQCTIVSNTGGIGFRFSHDDRRGAPVAYMPTIARPSGTGVYRTPITPIPQEGHDHMSYFVITIRETSFSRPDYTLGIRFKDVIFYKE